jgi:NTP pyrophosphatase (non-canonical NTP hydrolase)
MSLTPDEYQNLAHRTEAPVTEEMRSRICQDQIIRLLHAGIGIATELGEFFDVLKKHIYYGQEVDRTNLSEETGDSLWYQALACNALGESLSTTMQTNIDKLRKRFPERYTDHDAAEENRNREAEREILEEGLNPTGGDLSESEIENHTINAELGSDISKSWLVLKARENGVEVGTKSFEDWQSLGNELKESCGPVSKLERDITIEVASILQGMEGPKESSPEQPHKPHISDVHTSLREHRLCPFCKAKVTSRTVEQVLIHWGKDDRAVLCQECQSCLNKVSNYSQGPEE